MLARWNLKTAAGGVEVSYDNIRDGVSLDCGFSDAPASELIDFMVQEGGGGGEVVFLDGHFYCHLMPALSDRAQTWFLTSIFELQG